MLRRFTIQTFVFAFFVAGLWIAPAHAQIPNKTAVYAPGESIIIGFSGLLDPAIDPQTDEDVYNALVVAVRQTPTVTVDGVEFTLEVLPQEDACDEDGGRTTSGVFMRNPKVIGAIGPTCSSACRTFALTFDQSNYTSISTSCTAASLAGEFESFNRLIANDDAQGVEGAIFAIDNLGYTDIAVIHDDTDYGVALADIFGASVEQLGGTLVYSGGIARGQTEFVKIVAELQAAQPELIFYAGLAVEAADLLKATRAAGLSAPAFMVSDGVISDEFVELSDGLAEGVYASQPAAPDTKALDQFNAFFVSQFGRPPNTIYHPYAVDALNIFRAAIESVGEIDSDGNLVIDRLALRAFISSYGQTDPVDGLSGRLQCNGDGECALEGIAFYQVVDGDFTLLDSTMTIDLGY